DRPYQGNREDRDRKPYNSDFKRNDRGGDSSSKPPFKKFGGSGFEGKSDRPYQGNREDRDRKPYNSDFKKEGRSTERDGRAPFKKFGDKKSQDSRDRQVGMKRAPRYDEESLKRKAPFKA